MAIVEEIRDRIPEGSTILDDFSFDNSIIGLTLDNRVVYDFSKMVEELINDNVMTNELDAVAWIEKNTMESLLYIKDKPPIIMETIDCIY